MVSQAAVDGALSVHGCGSVRAVVELREGVRDLHHLTGHYGVSVVNPPDSRQADGRGTSGVSPNPIDAEVLRQRVTAVLAEHTALRAEILNRSNAQNILLGLHLTALIAILGSLTSAVGRWTVFLIPIEATVLGLWYMDHAVVIEQLGFHVQTPTEVNISRLLKDPGLIWWESRYLRSITDPPTPHVVAFRRLLPLTFLGPGLGLHARGRPCKVLDGIRVHQIRAQSPDAGSLGWRRGWDSDPPAPKGGGFLNLHPETSGQNAAEAEVRPEVAELQVLMFQ